MDFVNKTIVVTGSSRGIGASIIKKFASLGANVVINYNDSIEQARMLSDKIEKEYKVKTLLIKCDVSNEKEVKNMIETVVNRFNSIDILINNASIAIDTSFEDKTASNFKKILDVNLIGTFLVSKYAYKHMNRDSSIINIASTNGIDTNYVESLDYDASKAGVISLTHNLAKQFSPLIRVNAIAPGWVDTDMNKELDSNQIEDIRNNILLRRLAKADEIASVVLFLASKEASYINNTIIRVDGGELK